MATVFRYTRFGSNGYTTGKHGHEGEFSQPSDLVVPHSGSGRFVPDCSDMEIMDWGRVSFREFRFFRWGLHVSANVGLCSIFLGVAALLAVLVVSAREQWRRAALAIFAGSILCCVLLNQHCLQPWAYHFTVVAIVISLTRLKTAFLLLQWLSAGIYFHSAVSKLDYSFLVGHGQQLVEALLGNFALSMIAWPPGLRMLTAATLPLGELAVAIALLLPRTRRRGLWGATAMHVTLMLALSPWGLGHHPGVLLWNAFFIGQNWVLFSEKKQNARQNPQKSESNEENVRTRSRRHEQLAIGVVAIVLFIPVLEPLGLCDHWPAWELYASRPEKVSVFIHETRRDELPDWLLDYTDLPRFETPWCRIRTDRWSLGTLGAPIYPEDRFQLGVANAIGERFELKEAVRVVLESPANRWNGKRRVREFVGGEAIERELNHFVFNAQAEKAFLK